MCAYLTCIFAPNQNGERALTKFSIFVLLPFDKTPPLLYNSCTSTNEVLYYEIHNQRYMLSRNHVRCCRWQSLQRFFLWRMQRQPQGYRRTCGRYGYPRCNFSLEGYQMRSKANILPRPTCNSAGTIPCKQLIGLLFDALVSLTILTAKFSGAVNN